MNNDILRTVFPILAGGKTLLLRFAMAVAFLFWAAGAFAQHDVALQKIVDRDSVAAGDTVTFTIRVSNENMTNVAGLQVRDTLLPGLTYISHTAPAGTTYNVSNGIWMIGSQLDASTAELVLTIRTRVEWEGMYMNIAEVTDMAGTDDDSTPNNEELLEDDMDKACVSVPITICSQLNDSVRVTLLPMFTNIQWYKNGVLIPANQGGTQDTFYITQAGIFAFTATQNGCPTFTCCPVVVKDSCYDLALRKTLALGQNDTVNVGSLVSFTLEIFNQGDLAANLFSILDYVDLSAFAPFSASDNPPGTTSGDAAIPFAWANSGTNGRVTLNGELAPGESVQLPVTLRAAHGGQATNFAEINTDDDRDVDSQPENQEQDGNTDGYVDNETNNSGGDEDDHDGATLTILAFTINGLVWNDADHDGQQEPGEPGVAGIVVHLYDADDNLIATDTTAADGSYFFTDLPPGSYYVAVNPATIPIGYDVTLPNIGDDNTDNDADAAGVTPLINLGPGEEGSADIGIFAAEFDLALSKYLAPGQSNLVDLHDEVTYFIKITNEGILPAYHVDVMDNIPAGMALSPNDPNWTLTGTGNVAYTFAGPILPGQSDSIEIIMTVLYGASGQQIENTAEVVSAEDSNGIVYLDLDSTPNNGNPDEDDIDGETIELVPHDPTGWVYCDKTGKIITGGTVTVTGPNGIPNSQVIIVHDGSEGYYEFYTNGTPGVYTLSYSHALGIPLSPNCPPLAGQFDPTGLPDPTILGADTLNSEYLADADCVNNPYYLSFNLSPSDPIILHNNLPVRCILIASIVCNDANNNDLSDAGDQPIAGATVNLYECGNTTTPIATSITDSLGNYLFDGLEPGSYVVGYDLPPGVRTVSSGVIDENGFSPCITLTWGECDTTTYICLYTCPNVSAGPDLAHCSNVESSQLNATVPYGSGSYTWSPTTGLSNPNIANPVATPSDTTTYTVTYDDGLGCVDSDEMTIAVGNPIPFLTNAPFADTTIECTSPLVPFEAPMFADDCGSNVAIALDSTVTLNPCGRVIVRTWTATNPSGNSTTFTQTVTVDDNTPPTMFATHAFFGEIMDGDTLYADCTQIPSLDSLGFSAFDYCSATTVNFIENVTDGDCDVDGYIESRYCGWTATDACGNVDSLFFWVIITDNTPPTLAGVPANVDLPCGQSAPAAANVTASDLCDGSIPVVFNQTQVNNGCTATITRTWTSTDACGNTVSASQTINVVTDNQPPVFAGIPANTAGTCNNIPPVPANITATDNCGADVQIALSEAFTGNSCNYMLVRTWTATDACGNVATATQNIDLTDNDTPVLVGVPGNTTASCGSLPPVPTVTATDGCDTNLVVVFNEVQTGSGCAFTVTRTWTTSDDCGHVATASQVINVVDDQGPIITVTAPGLSWLSHGDTLIRQCNQILTLTAGSAIAADACCTTPPTMTFHEWVTAGNCQDDGYLQLMTCGWTAVDCCGNVDSLFFTVIVTDTIPPKLYGVPNNINLPCGQLPSANLPTVVAVDNCSNNLAVTLTADTLTIPGGFQIIRTWSSTDGCGNVGTNSQTITVTLTDVVPPVFANVPSNISLDCGSPIPPAASNVTASDICDSTPTISFNETTSGGPVCYTITRTWTATDDDGNTSTATQVITVTDTVAPTLVGVPANTAVACGSVPPPATVTATDNCSTNLQVNFSETQTTGCSYTITRTWTVTDDCGNTATQTQVISVSDLQPPVFAGVLPQNIVVECAANVPAPATLTASDVCDANVQVSFNEVQTGTGCTYTLTRTWTATDDCGNSATHTQVITVDDTQAPIFAGILPQDLAVDCASIPAPDSLTATDNCDANVEVTYGQVQNGSGCSYTLTRTWTATDDCGNQTIAEQTLTVTDNTPPVMFATHAFFGEIQHGDTLYADCSQIPSLDSIGFSATDLCGATTTNFTESVVQGNCSADGYTELRYCGWTATDECGNTDTLHFTVIISDQLAPTILGVPADATAECGQVPPVPNLTATDNCDQTPTLVFSETSTGSGCSYTLTRTWTATDDCGNVSTAEQIVTVADTEAPVFVGNLPQNTTAQCGNIPAPATLTATDGCDSTVLVTFEQMQSDTGCNYTLTRTWTATDDCGNSVSHVQLIAVSDTATLQIVFTNPLLSGMADGDTLVISCSDPSVFDASDAVAVNGCSAAPVVFSENSITPGDCATDGYIAIIQANWTANDTCGNTASITLQIMVVDNEPPVFSNVPADLTIGCNDTIPPCGSPTATDACGIVTLTSSTTTVLTANGFDQICTWTATDACGNEATATSTIHVVESGMTILSGVPADTTIYLAGNETVPPPATVTATEGCPAQPIPVDFSETSAPMGNDGCMVKITRTWSATDSLGNTVVQEQEITVVGFVDASVLSTTPDTCGNGVGIAVLDPPNYTYVWSDGGIGSTRTDLEAGTYTVTATNNGCSDVLTVNIPNMLVQLIVDIATTPESCIGDDGTASITPADYNYAWSDGGTGPNRTGLAAGGYTVTATDGNCSSVFFVNIANACNCEPAVLDSLITTPADCGVANGSATLELVGELADYSFDWAPDFGTPNAAGNARTDLPAGHYVVQVMFQNNSNCVEIIEFEIVDDCPRCAPMFPVGALTVNSSSAMTDVCVPVPFAIATQVQLDLDGQPLTSDILPCNVQPVLVYNFDNLTSGMLAVKWTFGTETYFTLADDLGEVAAFLNYVDFDGGWMHDPAKNSLSTANLKGNYGSLELTHLPTGATQIMQTVSAMSAIGTNLKLPAGKHLLTHFDAETGCSDTLGIVVLATTEAAQNAPSKLHDDIVRMRQGENATVNVLVNDDIKSSIKELKIANQPDNGSAWVNMDNTVSYRPLIEYCNDFEQQPLEQFEYEVCFEDGSRMKASVSVEVACVESAPATEIVLYPNPANRFVYLDLSAIAGQPADVVIFNSLGVKMQEIRMAEAPALPFRMELREYAAGHYAVRISTPDARPFVRQLIIGGK